LLVAAPAIGLLGGAVLAIRLMPRLAELLERLFARGRGLIAVLGGRQVARRPLRYTRAALLLILAAALGTFASAHAATWTRSQADQATWTAGADVSSRPARAGDAGWALGSEIAPSRGHGGHGRAGDRRPRAQSPTRRWSRSTARRWPTSCASARTRPRGRAGPPATWARRGGDAESRSGRHAAARGHVDLSGRSRLRARPGRPPGLIATAVIADGDGRSRIPSEPGPLGVEARGSSAADGRGWLAGADVARAPGRTRPRDVDLGPRRVCGAGHLVVAGRREPRRRGDADAARPAAAGSPRWTLDQAGTLVEFDRGRVSASLAFDALFPFATNTWRLIAAAGDAGADPRPSPARVPGTDGSPRRRPAPTTLLGVPVSSTSSGGSTPCRRSTGQAVRAGRPALSSPRGQRPRHRDGHRRVVAGRRARPGPGGGGGRRGRADRRRAGRRRTTVAADLSGDPLGLGDRHPRLGSLAALVFASIGFLVSATVSTTERMGELALLKALGLAPHQLLVWLSLESIGLLVTGLVAGTLLGLLLAWLVLPFATLTASGEPPVPAPTVVVPIEAAVPTAILATILVVATVILIRRQLPTARTSAVLRARDE
jgi:hypothetical protein